MELDRTSAERDATDLDRTSRPWKPVIWTYRRDGRTLLVKDLQYSRPFYRWTIGRFLLGREYRIYRKLDGLPFVPRCFGRFDRHSMVLEFVEAVSIRRCEDVLDPGFFETLAGFVERMHERGVIHMDLRHRSNIMRRPDGEPLLIDFESSIYVGVGWLSRKLLRPMFAWVDRSAVLKCRVRYVPDDVSPDERRRFERHSFWRRWWPFGRIWPPSRLFRRRRGPVARDAE